MAVASALSRATLATCRSHREGPSTNLKPGKHSPSDFKHLQAELRLGRVRFPEAEIPLSAVWLLQGVKSLGQGTASPTPLLMEARAEKHLRLSTLTAAEDTQFQVYYLKAFKSEKIKT